MKNITNPSKTYLNGIIYSVLQCKQNSTHSRAVWETSVVLTAEYRRSILDAFCSFGNQFCCGTSQPKYHAPNEGPKADELNERQQTDVSFKPPKTQCKGSDEVT